MKKGGRIKDRAKELALEYGLTYETIKKVVTAKDVIAERNRQIVEAV